MGPRRRVFYNGKGLQRQTLVTSHGFTLSQLHCNFIDSQTYTAVVIIIKDE